ncbi:MAG TPA: hypothetical protein VMU25_00145 [Candidatus Paceibacterota bacterium]|nr:hypothetical protein [Candidatus Paceibacterota bacterium]
MATKTFLSSIFFKKGALRLNRQLVVHGQKILVRYGQGSSVAVELVLREDNPLVLGEKFAEAFRRAGFSEYSNPKEGLVGRISFLEGPRGPGRVRVDAIGDVYFDERSHSIKKLEVGKQVVVFDIAKNPNEIPSFMLGSDLKARELTFLLPETKHKKVELPATVRERILKNEGASLRGSTRKQTHQQELQFGQLIYGYYAGIYRILKIEHGLAYCEQLYTGKLLRAPGRIDFWASEYCRPLHPEIAKLLEAESLIQR